MEPQTIPRGGDAWDWFVPCLVTCRLIDGEIPAVSLFSGPYNFAEQLGFRKVIDTRFMTASMITGDPDPEDVRCHFGALRRAQRDINLRLELYTKHYRHEFPERFHDVMDTRRWGLVFEPYTREVFEESFNWIAEREISSGARWGQDNTTVRSCHSPAAERQKASKKLEPQMHADAHR